MLRNNHTGKSSSAQAAAQLFPTLSPETATPPTASEQFKQQRILHATLATITHFFGPLSRLFVGVDDPRDQAKITYPLASLLWTGVWMFLCQLGARRQIAIEFRDNAPSETNFARLFGTQTVPHGDTLEEAFARLKPEQAQACVTALTETLIRKKVLQPYRLLDQYYVIAIDGTGIYSFSTRHCEHCLTRTHKGKTTYYHNLLEAKLITWDGFAFSLMTEFIENPAPNPTKQDCELKAFYRLAERLKERFPRLPICLSLDGLFACGPVFQICLEAGWKCVVVLKEKDLPTVHTEFLSLSKLHPEQQLRQEALSPTGTLHTEQGFRWVNGIEYLDTQKREHQLSVIECQETKTKIEAQTEIGTTTATRTRRKSSSGPKIETKTETNPDGEAQTTRFLWVSNLPITKSNVREVAQQAGRDRWKIENEGFNSQKQGGFALEHLYTHDQTSAKIFYFLLQIAHLLFQLTVAGSLLKKYFPRGFGSLRKFAERLCEAWRNSLLAPEILFLLEQLRCQIRFDTS